MPNPLPPPPTLPVPGDLLSLTGTASVGHFSNHEAVSNIDFSFNLQNISGQNVTITHAEWYVASLGGWIESGPMALIPNGTSPGNFFGYGPVINAGQSCPKSGGWGDGFFDYVLFLLHATAPGYYQDLIAQLPTHITPATTWSVPWPPGMSPPSGAGTVPPPVLPLSAPVFITLMEPVYRFAVSNGKVWVGVTGQIVNGTGGSIGMTAFRWILSDDNGNQLTGNIPIQFTTPSGAAVDLAAGPTAEKILQFNVSIELQPNQGFPHLRLEADCTWGALLPFHQVVRTAQVVNPSLEVGAQLVAPVSATGVSGAYWNFGNGVTLQGFNIHNSNTSQRFAYDIGMHVNGSSLKPGAPPDKNTSYWCYDQPIVAMEAGTIIHVVENGIANNGNVPASPAQPPNVVVLQHDSGRFSLYAHVVSGSVSALGLSPGSHVAQGQQIARIGNVGWSTEPHLHVACYDLSPPYGLHRALPQSFKNLKDTVGNLVRAVPINGFHGTV
ncbi:MAG: M23 family metallopeptidase [Minicystis sp.]